MGYIIGTLPVFSMSRADFGYQQFNAFLQFSTLGSSLWKQKKSISPSLQPFLKGEIELFISEYSTGQIKNCCPPVHSEYVTILPTDHSLAISIQSSRILTNPPCFVWTWPTWKSFGNLYSCQKANCILSNLFQVSLT